MFALIAAILWLLVALGVNPDEISFVWLGAASFALHFAWKVNLPWPPRRQ